MTPATASAMATALETLAQALREEATEPKRQEPLKLSVAAKETGYSVSTLSELLRTRQIEGVRRGRGRGHWYVTAAAIEAYDRKRTQPVRLGLRGVG